LLPQTVEVPTTKKCPASKSIASDGGGFESIFPSFRKTSNAPLLVGLKTN
jgi:hypothetical protein